MFQAIRLLVVLAVLTGIAGVAFYFAPNNIKERGLDYISGISFLPGEIKKTAEDIYATPAYRREKLLGELDNNLFTLREIVEANLDNPEAAVETLDRTKEIVEEVLKQNDDPGVINQITAAVTEKLLSNKEKICPTPSEVGQ
ncbi:MAG: hypothetical protein HYT03_01345 [Candidatus Harrisonbacteria bacterium]|nr:hypothetical protein [Candidatus Harrisonbacteria bacterium]